MRVLMTTNQLASWTGAELYVADVALDLHRRGHDVAVHVVVAGPLARQLEGQGIRILRRPTHGAWRPDVIHAQGNIGTRAALANHPGVPILFVCHTHDQWTQFISAHPSIRRYAGVSRVCTEALLRSGTPLERTVLLPNFVDTTVFSRRSPLPSRPQRAVMFSNFARPGGYLDVVEAACSRLGLPLDHIGAGTGTASSAPQELLPRYDVVFAKGRAAMEALAVGCAVVLCDFAGVGPMVTLSDFDRLREANFGFAALTRPHETDVLVDEIQRYEAADASLVCDRIREDASLERYLDEIETLYRALVEESRGVRAPRRPTWLERGQTHALTAALRTYHRVPLKRRLRLRPVTATILRAP
jgi:hypothetical protein